MMVGGIVVLIGGAVTVMTMSSSKPSFVGPGAAAPTFAADRGKPVLLNIWATWCAPCREEMPRIQKLYKELGDSGLVVVAVSIDNPGMADAIREFRKEMGLGFEILYDDTGKIRDDYQTTGVPETFLIDRKGIVRRRLIGASWTEDEQRPMLRELLAEPATANK
jgi:cytochrome c biogenesis protein CcmG/thiol:disulfide interchange protein DsbE